MTRRFRATSTATAAMAEFPILLLQLLLVHSDCPWRSFERKFLRANVPSEYRLLLPFCSFFVSLLRSLVVSHVVSLFCIIPPFRVGPSSSNAMLLPLSSFPPVYTLQSKPERVCWLVAGLRCLRSIGSRATRRMERSSSSSSSNKARARSVATSCYVSKEERSSSRLSKRIGWSAVRFPVCVSARRKGRGGDGASRGGKKDDVSSRSLAYTHTHTHTHTHTQTRTQGARVMIRCSAG